MSDPPPHAERDRAWLESALGARSPVRVRLLGYGDAGREVPSDRADEHVAVALHAGAVFVGPVIAARQPDGPCARCFAVRWQRNREAEHQAVLDQDRQVHAVGAIPALTPFLVGLVAGLCTMLAEDGAAGALYQVDTGTLRVRRHRVLAVPDCPCRPAPAPRPAVALRPRPRAAPDADRLRSPADLLGDTAALVNSACGALGTAVRPDHEHTTTAPATGHFLLRDVRELFPVHWTGHGDGYAHSGALALCEAMERYAGLACGVVPTEARDSYANVTVPAIDPADCGLYDPAAEHGTEVFHDYHPELPIHWVTGYSLTGGHPVLVPRQLAYYRTEAGDAVFVKESSNGCAGGSCVEEAALHGTLEVIERDAFLLAWYGAARLPSIDPDSCRSAATAWLLARVRRLGYQVWLLDARIDLDIPVVIALARRRDRGALGALSVSAAAHLDPERAAAAALREVASSVADLAERTTADEVRLRELAADYDRVSTLADHAALFGLPEPAELAQSIVGDDAPRSMEQTYAGWHAVRPGGPDLTGDLRFCVEHLAGHGFEAVAVDQTTEEAARLGMSVVRVLVPGMIPIDFGWAKQRALRMPRMLRAFRLAGWRTTDLDPAFLRRVPHPFM